MINEIVIEKAAIQLKRHEGYRKFPYTCTAGKLTCGYGRNLEDVGITQAEAEILLFNDIKNALNDLKIIFTDFEELPEQIQIVLVNMRFQLGSGGFRQFKQMIQACKMRQWHTMANQMRKSKWYTQTPGRAEELASIVESVK